MNFQSATVPWWTMVTMNQLHDNRLWNFSFTKPTESLQTCILTGSLHRQHASLRLGRARWWRTLSNLLTLSQSTKPGAHQMELPSPLISWVNPFPSIVINTGRTIFFWNALQLHECACCLLSFLYFHWLFPLLASKISSGSRSIYKSNRERIDSKGLYGKWRFHLMGSWPS